MLTELSSVLKSLLILLNLHSKLLINLVILLVAGGCIASFIVLSENSLEVVWIYTFIVVLVFVVIFIVLYKTNY